MREMISTPEVLVYYDAIQQATEEFRQAVTPTKTVCVFIQQILLLKNRNLPRAKQQVIATAVILQPTTVMAVVISSPEDLCQVRHHRMVL